MVSGNSRIHRDRRLRRSVKKFRTSAYYDTDKELTPAVARREANKAWMAVEVLGWGISVVAVVIDRILRRAN